MDILDSWFQSIRGGNLKEAVSIYKNNPDIINKFTTINDGRNHYKTNAIIEASFQGNRDLVKWLIDNNADVNSVSDGGWRPIHFAAQHGHVTTVNLLVLGGAEVNVKTETSETPIFLALQAYMRDTVKKLMYHGASLVGIDRGYLQMWIQKDVLDPSCLDEENKNYLAETNYNKTDINGYDMIIRQTEKKFDEIKIVKITKGKLFTDYDNDLRRRRQELVKKMRRVNEQPGTIATLVKKIALSDNDEERIEFIKEVMLLFESQDTQMPQTKTLDHLINLLELCICDSDSSEEFIRLASKLMMIILQNNARRGDSAVVDFWCRIFDKMSNLQIEQYTLKILEMLTYMIETANDTVIGNFKIIKETFLKTWEYFFENLGFPKCLSTALKILKLVHELVPESVNHRFHNVIDIMIGWCIHPDTDLATLESIRARSADLHNCWVSDIVNLKKTIANLQKDVISHCQILGRIHRVDKDRSQVDELRLKIRYFCFALSCVTAGISGITDTSEITQVLQEKIEQPLSNTVIVSIIDKLCESMVICSKQIDFDNLLLQSNTVILHLLVCVDREEPLPGMYTNVLRYVFGTTLPLQSRTLTEGSANINYNTRQLLSSHLDLIHICCTHSILEPSMIIQIFSPANWIHSCLFYGSTLSRDLMRRFLRTVDVVIRSPVMSTFYQILLSDLEVAINALLKFSGSSKQVHLVQSNAFKTKTYDSDQAELVVKYNLNMMLLLHHRLKDPTTLVPSIPMLLHKYLALYDTCIIDKFPSTALFILETISSIDTSAVSLYDRIKYNCYFLRANGLSMTSKKTIFDRLDEILNGYDYDSDKKEKIINVVLRTMVDLSEVSGHDDGSLVVTEDSEGLVVRCVLLVHSLVRLYGGMVDPLVKTMVRGMVTKYTEHTNTEIRLASFDIYYRLLGSNEVDITRHTQTLALRTRTYRFPLDFTKKIFSWIISSTEEYTFNSSDTMRLYHLIGGNTNHTFTNRMTLLYDIISNTCWDCVRQKLRFDPSGDSRATLMTIENLVKCILTNGAYTKTISDKRFRRLMATFTSKGPLDKMLTINLVTLLLDVLEKMCYNSYEGCSVGIPPVHKTTEAFFVANKNVCSEWFLKMRLIVVALAQYTGQWATVVWHGMQLLTHYLGGGRDDAFGDAGTNRSLVPEIEDCIVFTAMALSKLGQWETLVGLGCMVVRTYGTKFSWVDALADKTIGHLEAALTKFEDYVRVNHDPDTVRQASEVRLLSRKPTGHSSFILCMEEIADCHRLLANDTSLDKWAEQMSTWKEDSSVPEAHKSSINWTRLACLARLSKWDHSLDDSKPKEELSPLIPQTEYSWKYRSMTDYCEDTLYCASITKSMESVSDMESLATKLASVQSVCDYPTALNSPEIILITERTRCLRQVNDAKTLPIIVDTKSLATISPTLPLMIINYCNALQKSYGTEHCFSNQKYLIQWHRHLANYNKCAVLIAQCGQAFLGTDMARPTTLSGSKAPIIQMHLQRQSTKLLWATKHKSRALELLTTSLKESLLYETSDVSIHTAKCHLNTKSLLTLFHWLSNDKTAFSLCADGPVSCNIQFLTELAEVPWINGLPLVSPQQRSSDRPCQSSVTDVCSQLLILASKAKNQEHNDKSFMTLAQWCLNRSRSLDEAGFSNQSIDSITESLISNNVPEDIVVQITHLFSRTFTPGKMESEEDWLGYCYDDDEFITGLKSSIIKLDPDLSEDVMSKILILWKTHVINHFSLHIAASDAYFSFLKDSRPQKNKSNSLCNKNQTTANLRILSLLGKRSRSLRESIITKIKTSPASSWANVIPQLFARIKHPDNVIQNSATELLQRFAVSDNNRCRLIIYPTIVGTMSEDIGSSAPFNEIKKVLCDNNASLVYEVETFVKELRRITVLWDELWIASLNQCYEELSKKTSQLQLEIERITKDECADHADIILQLKYNSIIQPALFILERVQVVTSVVPETPREVWFNDTFNEEIKSTINAIKTPTDIHEFKECWRKVKDLQELMVTESNDNSSSTRVRRGRQQLLSLKLGEVSPSLAAMAKTKIPMPGRDDSDLMSVHSHITILPTKTRPKRLQFMATDGKAYHYLYKGLEDLRLDQRIMDILKVANTMLEPKYQVTTYSVTPVGPRAGLIQMVEGCTSLFSLYKRHCVRRARHQAGLDITKADSGDQGDTGVQVRPTDMYWAKLAPRLEAARLDTSMDARDKWPTSLVVDVLEELRRDTPGDLLAKELWCCSVNTTHWLQSCARFTRSCAAMSMLGYVLGLGDRHLDNLLVDLVSGQMVHIDYNVCFDKGLTLKVPERVPFRLTGIITDVFGPPGLEGLYRESCETVLDTVMQCQDNVLTMMDTFVLDPVVDWATGVEAGHYGSLEAGKYALGSARATLDRRMVEFVIALNQMQAILVTLDQGMTHGMDEILRVLGTMAEAVTRCQDVCVNIGALDKVTSTKAAMIDYLAIGEHDTLVARVHHMEDVCARAATIDQDLRRRLIQMEAAMSDHGAFFNMMLSNTDYISFKLDMKNMCVLYTDSVSALDRTTRAYVAHTDESDESKEYLALVDEVRSWAQDMEAVQDGWPVFDKYRTLLLEMPESYYGSDRCTHMAAIVKDLCEDKNEANMARHMAEYDARWVSGAHDDEIGLVRERDHWLQLQQRWSTQATQTPSVTKDQTTQDELQTLEQIWHMTMYEGVLGIQLFKAVLLDQYLDMASMAGHTDRSLCDRIAFPDQVSLSVDYNEPVHRYIQLLTAHDNYLKILHNCTAVYGGLYAAMGEAAPVMVVVCGLLTSLHKMCVGLASCETSYVEILVPESVKIVRSLALGLEEDTDDVALIKELRKLVSETSDPVVSLFQRALAPNSDTSVGIDLHDYETRIHNTVIAPSKSRMARITDIKTTNNPSQLRLLMASYQSTLSQTQVLISDFIDLCLSSSTPSAWNYLDLVATSGQSISPIWTKSHQLLKDMIYVTGLQALLGTLDQCTLITNAITLKDTSTDTLSQLFVNMLRPMELYLHMINRHVIAGVGSQCFGKMFCLLLEFAGWNLDAMVEAQSAVPGSAGGGGISADYICGSVASFRKTEYPNASNFYGQLQLRFNNYKTVTGLAGDPGQSARFIARNVSLHKSLCHLARSELLRLCWTKRHVLGLEYEGGDLALVGDMSRQLTEVHDRMDRGRAVLAKIEVLENDMKAVDEKEMDRWVGEDLESVKSAHKAMVEARTTSLASVRKRLHAVIGAMVSLDRFECLRHVCDRGRAFDMEIIQFLGDMKTLVVEQNKCEALATNALEEDIVRCMDRCGVNEAQPMWWTDLKNILEAELTTATQNKRNEQQRLSEEVGRYKREVALLKAVVTSHYQPLVGPLRPSLRTLYTVSRKIRALVLGPDNHINYQGKMKTHLATVWRLMTLFERFNSAMDSVTMTDALVVTDTGEYVDTDTTIEALATYSSNIDCLRRDVVADLWEVLRSLSPLVTSATNDTADYTDMTDYQVGFSNNNMAESNGEQSMGSIGTATMAVVRASPPPPAALAALGVDYQDMDITSTTDKDHQTNGGDSRRHANNSGVQRAVDVWRLVEGRVRRTGDKDTQQQDSSGKQHKEAVAQHVERCIRAATSPENLARMYEGWTAWV